MIKSILTWNNISKYCLPSIILNSEKIPISEQWFNEQLIHMSEHLDIDILNEFELQIPRRLMIDKIKMYNANFSFEYCDECARLGMTKLTKIENEYNYQNIGGKIAQSIKYEMNKVIIDNTKILFNINNKDKIEINPVLDKRFILSYANPTKKTTTKKQISFISLIDQISQKNRKDLSIKQMSKAKTPWEKWGKIDHYQKSSSLDCILMMMFVSELEPFFNQILIISEDDNFFMSLSNTIDPNTLKKKIEHFLDEINSYKEQILDGNIINISHFRERTRGLFGKIKLLNKPYYNTINYYPLFFIKDIFKLFNKTYSSYTRLTRYYIDKNEILDYSGTDGKIFQNPIVDNILYETTQELLSEHVIFSIDSSILKYLLTRNAHVNYDDYVNTGRLEEIKYCEKCNEFYERSIIRNHEKSWHKNNKVEIQELMTVQIDVVNTDWVISDGWDTKKIGETNVFFKIDEEHIIENYLNESDLLELENPPAVKFERNVDNMSIYNANLIIFDFNRKLGRKNLNTLSWESEYYEELPIVPNENIIDLNGFNYSLETIITNRNNLCMLFFKNQKTWLCYNSHYNVENSSDYISVIGNYDNLIEYKDKFVSKHGVLYIYKLIN
jgi:hypothetical protein